MKTKHLIYLITLIFSIEINAQIQSENILFSINEKENFIIDDYILYSEKGKFPIDEESSTKNEYNYFLTFKKKIIGRYTLSSKDNEIDKIEYCELYVVNKKASYTLGIRKNISLITFKKSEFLKEISISLNDSTSTNLINSVEILNNKGYFLYKYKYFPAALLYFNKVIEKFPNRIVAYLNIADCYWSIKEKEKAILNYKKYIQLMKDQKKDLKKIPKYVYQRVK